MMLIYLVCVEPWLMKSCLKPAGTKLEYKSCSLVTEIGNTFSCPKFSHKTLAKLPKHVHFRPLWMIQYMHSYPLPFQSLILKSPMYQDLTHQIIYLTMLQYQCQMRKSQSPVMSTFGQMHIWWTFIWDQCSVLRWRREDRWIPVNCLQIYFKPPI